MACKILSVSSLCLSLLAAGLFGVAKAEDQSIKTVTSSFGVKLDKTRVIFNGDAQGESLGVNNPQAYPILVQTKMYAEDKKSSAPYLVTPPLLRLEGNQKTRLRIIKVGKDLPQDRESLSWLCVTGMPPNNEVDKTPIEQATVDLKMIINVCDKVFYRPEGLKGNSDNVADSLSWTRDGERLKVENTTPFYMNLDKVFVGDEPVADVDYVAPFSSREFKMPKSESRNVRWTVIRDIGAAGRDHLGVVK